MKISRLSYRQVSTKNLMTFESWALNKEASLSIQISPESRERTLIVYKSCVVLYISSSRTVPSYCLHSSNCLVCQPKKALPVTGVVGYHWFIPTRQVDLHVSSSRQLSISWPLWNTDKATKRYFDDSMQGRAPRFIGRRNLRLMSPSRQNAKSSATSHQHCCFLYTSLKERKSHAVINNKR